MNFSRSRQSTAQPTPRRSGAVDRSSHAPVATPRSTAAPELPPYEPPTYPLNAKAQRALANLTRTLDNRKLLSQLAEAQSVVTASALDINERATDRRERTARVREKRRRQQDGGEDDDADETQQDMEAALARQEEQVKSMTARMEETIRKLIDGKQYMTYTENAVAAAAQDARDNASTQPSIQSDGMRRSRRARGDGQEEEGPAEEDEDVPDPTDPAPGTQEDRAPLKVFQTRLEEDKSRYQAFSLVDRYSQNNEYISFKRNVHEAQFPNGDVPLSNPSEWFDSDGPVAAPGQTQRRDGDDESDDGIEIQRAYISTKCPLTLQEFDDPVSSTKCSHSFEKCAILEFFGRQHQIRCPVGGCNEQLTRQHLHTDPIIVRRIRRLQAAKRRQEEEEEEGGDGDDDDDAGATQYRSHVIESDDEDEDVDVDATDEEEEKSPSANTKNEP